MMALVNFSSSSMDQEKEEEEGQPLDRGQVEGGLREEQGRLSPRHLERMHGAGAVAGADTELGVGAGTKAGAGARAGEGEG